MTWSKDDERLLIEAVSNKTDDEDWCERYKAERIAHHDTANQAFLEIDDLKKTVTTAKIFLAVLSLVLTWLIASR
jgi:hypothetical protein